MLNALANQSSSDFDVVISEDGNHEPSAQFIRQSIDNYRFRIRHLHQKVDDGFRKNEILNKVLALETSDNLAFIDGDCVPHKHFVREYINVLKTGFYFTGRALMLSDKLTQHCLKTKSIQALTFWKIFRSNSDRKKDFLYSGILASIAKPRGLVGRNWGIKKQHLLDINGFDEDYVKAGVGEDVDLEWRLRASGIAEKTAKHRAIALHLWHPKGYSEDDVALNFEMLTAKKELNNISCINGIKKLK